MRCRCRQLAACETGAACHSLDAENTATASCKRSPQNAGSGYFMQRLPNAAQDLLSYPEGCQMDTAASPLEQQHLAAGSSALSTIKTRP
jgi:hypothetical protein